MTRTAVLIVDSGAGTGTLLGLDLDALGIPGLDAYIAAYEARTGRLLWRRRVAPSSDRIPVFRS